jgi:hypothetical protein
MGAGYSLEEKTIRATPDQIVQLPQTKKHDIQYTVVQSVDNQKFIVPKFLKPGQFEFSTTAEASDIVLKLDPTWIDHEPPYFNTNGELTLTKGDSILLEGRVIEQPNFQLNKFYITAAYIISPTGASDL